MKLNFHYKTVMENQTYSLIFHTSDGTVLNIIIKTNILNKLYEYKFVVTNTK